MIRRGSPDEPIDLSLGLLHLSFQYPFFDELVRADGILVGTFRRALRRTAHRRTACRRRRRTEGAGGGRP
ncbi:MAG: hypothetical protein A2Z99_19980 [Treponema sp. GWB1_62_6]|nr:MAG: hypothetical protein A2001_09555 [Treponema sp. GWC1_61_84]OHE69427.1 MAG: hypothetical protein A2Z99_19980 [Treponema sp. GWB1_62_6]OHE72319.1 MAG: hypothetical protein A2413_06130 [Treponema sp. RIFOXYC1_FULL_61_9]HCM28802.1 hypothetical protein [Treponema sp.]